MIRDKKHLLTATAVFFLVGSLLAIGLNININKGQQKYQNLDQKINPAGFDVNDSDTYRISDLNGSNLYGPYEVNNRKYFIHEGNVLGPNLEPRSSKKAKNLHNLYLKTYLDPLFYTPFDNDNEINMTGNTEGFEQFEDDKILTRKCGLKYDTIPSSYFQKLEKNIKITNEFYRKPSIETSEDLIDANRKTLSKYLGYVNNFTENLRPDLKDNDCFKGVMNFDSSGVATDTPVRKSIKIQKLENYAAKANKNSRKLQRQINRREKIIKKSKKVSLNLNKEFKFENLSYSYSDGYTANEAKQELNKRRKKERDNIGEAWNSLRLVNDVRGYEITPYCLERNNTLVYGDAKNIYPNIILGEEVGIFKDNEEHLQDFFTVCRCPYVEISRLNWYVVDDIYSKFNDNNIGENKSQKIRKSEENFRKYPGQRSLNQLAESYDYSLRKEIENKNFNKEIPEMWKVHHQADSKLHKFGQANDDFYNSYHMEVWQSYFPLKNKEKLTVGNYFYHFSMGSQYALNFMTYSDSVWRLKEKPSKFSGIIEPENSSGIEETYQEDEQQEANYTANLSFKNQVANENGEIKLKEISSGQPSIILLTYNSENGTVKAGKSEISKTKNKTLKMEIKETKSPRMYKAHIIPKEMFPEQGNEIEIIPNSIIQSSIYSDQAKIKNRAYNESKVEKTFEILNNLSKVDWNLENANVEEGVLEYYFNYRNSRAQVELNQEGDIGEVQIVMDEKDKPGFNKSNRSRVTRKEAFEIAKSYLKNDIYTEYTTYFNNTLENRYNFVFRSKDGSKDAYYSIYKDNGFTKTREVELIAEEKLEKEGNEETE